MRYSRLEGTILALFAKPEWKDHQIETIPSNFVREDSETKEYIRLNVLTGATSINRISRTGTLIVDIFTLEGVGLNRPAIISDLLDDLLVNKTFPERFPGKGIIQFSTSTSSFLGRDGAVPSLVRTSYSLPFAYNGAF